MLHGLRRMLVAWVLVWGSAACTSSHDVESSGQALVGGRGGSGGGGAAGQAARAGSSASSAGRGGGNATLSCAGKTCMGGNVFGVALPGCCTADDKCGIDLAAVGFGGCEEANAPGAANAACPSQTIAGILPLSGCCKPNGTCGGLDTFVGLGCISVSGAASCTP